MDKYHDSVVISLLEAQDLAHTDTQSKYVDREGYESVEIEVEIGALTGVDASNHVTPILQEADDTPAAIGSYSACASGDMIGGLSKVDDAAEDSVIQRVCYTGLAPYLNVALDYTGIGISAGIVGVRARLSNPRKGPASSLTPTTGTVS